MMYDELIENDPKMKKMLSEREEKGRAEGVRSLRKAVVRIAQGRFPTLVELARQRTSNINKLNVLDRLLADLIDAPDEAAACALLEAREHHTSKSK